MPDNACLPSGGWDIAASAAANSQLAGVLAGFVFTGFIILFGREGPKNAQTLSLFVVSFAALGFDSYLFSYVTGSAADTVCARTWFAGMVASGLLVVGAIALISGIAWLVVEYLNHAALTPLSDDDASAHNERKETWYASLLTTAFPLCIQLPATLLLTSTIGAYFELQGVADTYLSAAAWIVPILVAGLVLVSRIWRRHVLRRAMQSNAHRISDGDSAKSGRAYWLSLGALLLYTIAAPVATGLLTVIGDDYWRTHALEIGTAALASTLVIPTLIVAWLSAAVPDLSINAYRAVRNSDTRASGTVTEMPPISSAALNHRPTKQAQEYIVHVNRIHLRRKSIRIAVRPKADESGT